jgi:pyruvate/2-oxoglutarate/acetoin dehydrogenase E1 component/TPP-dependent pyruvate/acetoin dehydrogenase alpha subunit
MIGERPRLEGRVAGFTRESILRDYRIAYQSRQASLLGRREVLTGKAKFGIFGDGKEVAQVALARAVRKGDFRSGYYRDQTLMLALGVLHLDEFFAQLYADADPRREPCSAGRQMTAHFATAFLDEEGRWRDLTTSHNSSADLSPTGSQMPRLVGLAWASKLYRELRTLPAAGFSRGGDEVAFGTIGNASCAEGMFWESVNAAGVLGVPMLLSIWDDGYGISVPNEQQLTKGDLSALLRGFRREPGRREGFDLYTVRGWDYPGLCETYLAATEIVRREHVPAIVHVVEMTQPQGHSTSGSHERYKSAERLAWEEDRDCISRMRRWLLAQGLAEEAELAAGEREDLELVRRMQERSWEETRRPLDAERERVVGLLGDLAGASRSGEEVRRIVAELERRPNPLRRDVLAAAAEALVATVGEVSPARERLVAWRDETRARGRELYGSHLVAAGGRSALAVPVVPARYAADAPELRGFEVLNACFDAALTRRPELVCFGEDVGKLGDVNQGFAGLQEKYGPLRVSDTGIRETTILGQAIGLALRGLRPLCEIQYLDYVLYALQIMSDDLATLRWRTRGLQGAPVIVRTRGHRLEGVWHAGSPMAGILNLVRGMWVCVPRDMVQAAGMYNTLLAADDPAIVVEVLNGYRLRERLPANVGEMTVPLGVPEVLREGGDVTIVTYGACCRIALEAASLLAGLGVEAEVLDVQTLLPFDREGRIVSSLRKTGRVVFVDEDVPGGATAYMLQQALTEQGGFAWLDAAPVALSARPHRPAYGSDGDYFSKPNREDVLEAAYGLVRERDPRRFPPLGS